MNNHLNHCHFRSFRFSFLLHVLLLRVLLLLSAILPIFGNIPLGPSQIFHRDGSKVQQSSSLPHFSLAARAIVILGGHAIQQQACKCSHINCSCFARRHVRYESWCFWSSAGSTTVGAILQCRVALVLRQNVHSSVVMKKLSMERNYRRLCDALMGWCYPKLVRSLYFCVVRSVTYTLPSTQLLGA